MKKAAKSAFTLIELVLVVAILAIIASLAVAKFSDLRKQSAQKVNLANMQSLTRAAQAYIASNRDTVGTFNRLESLLDIDSSGKAWYGDTAGSYDWDRGDLSEDNVPGIYRGVKRTSVMTNADGDESAAKTLEEYRNQNQGITSGLADQLAIYYLDSTDVAQFKAAGISNYLLHNYLPGQASLLATQNEDGTTVENGGPGFRADMSAFYRCALTNGSPVVILNPAKASSTFKAFGCGFDLEYGSSYTGKQLYDDGVVTYRLFCFGLGKTCEFARQALDTVPRDEVYGREYYRNYILVFKQPTSKQSGRAVSFAGVLDADGNAFSDARFQLDWR